MNSTKKTTHKDDDTAELFLLGVTLGKEKAEQERDQKIASETKTLEIQQDKEKRQAERTEALVQSKLQVKEREKEREKRLGSLNVTADKD